MGILTTKLNGLKIEIESSIRDVTKRIEVTLDKIEVEKASGGRFFSRSLSIGRPDRQMLYRIWVRRFPFDIDRDLLFIEGRGCLRFPSDPVG